jgi:DNA-binding transcriptional LysR family regulator
VVVANPSHQLSDRSRVKIEDLSGQDFILMEELAPYTVHFQRIMASHYIEYHSFLKLQSADMARSLVEKGSFLSVLPLYSVKDSVIQGKICILEIPELKQVQSVQLVFHINKVLTPQVQVFMEELRDVFQKVITIR